LSRQQAGGRGACAAWRFSLHRGLSSYTQRPWAVTIAIRSARTGERRCCQPVRKLEGRLRRFEQDAPPQFSRDLKTFVYTYERITSDLYVVDGLK